MYKRRQKRESGLEGVGPREIIRVYERRNRNAARSKEEILVGECNTMYMWQQGIGEENCAIMGESEGNMNKDGVGDHNRFLGTHWRLRPGRAEL